MSLSLILVGELSFDYGLFFNRSKATGDDALRTRYSVMVCSVSTLGAFALLMLSRMPVLEALRLDRRARGDARIPALVPGPQAAAPCR